MNAGLEMIIIAAIWFTQILLGILSLWRSRHLDRKFAYPLASKTSVVNLLEKYSRIYGAINVKVNAVIKQPALLRPEILWINRAAAYNEDLYSTFFTTFQLALLNLSNHWFQAVLPWQMLAYMAQIGLAILALAKSQDYLILVVLVSAGLLIVSWALYFYAAFISATALDMASDLLDLDEIEVTRAKRLAGLFQTDIFKYAIYPVVWLVKFILPARS